MRGRGRGRGRGRCRGKGSGRGGEIVQEYTYNTFLQFSMTAIATCIYMYHLPWKKF